MRRPPTRMPRRATDVPLPMLRVSTTSRNLVSPFFHQALFEEHISLCVRGPFLLTTRPIVEEKKIEITLPIETQKTGWYARCYIYTLRRRETNPANRKLNTSPSTIEDKDILKLHLINPPVKKIDLHFPLGLEVTARNMKGVTIKDALDAIYKQFKKKVSCSRRCSIRRLPSPPVILTSHPF